MSETSRPSEPGHEELVAYLDGELDPASARRLEARLDSEPVLRQEIQTLRRAWDLLDFLPRPEVNQSFTERTVALSQAGPDQLAEPVPRHAGLRAAGWVTAIALGFAAGFAVVAYWPDPNRRLVQDLDVLEQLDEYRAAGDIEFVRQLHQRELLDALDEPRSVDNGKKNGE